MNDIGVVSDGAVLIHNDSIVECGPARRIESLRQARTAREIDAGGRLVMPAFVDPDAVLVSRPMHHPDLARADGARANDVPSEIELSVVSRKRLEIAASVAAAELARAGVLTIGAHTGNASDLRETLKILLIHRGLQNRPLRIRSVFSPTTSPDGGKMTEDWLLAVRKRKLASILELTVSVSPQFRKWATAGASTGYSLRIRSSLPLDCDSCELALEGGAIAAIGPPTERLDYVRGLAALGCVHVLPAGDVLYGGRDFAPPVRDLITEGGALALASGYSTRGSATFNPQFLLFLATSRFGLTPEEAICATTWNAACSLRMSHSSGSLEAGRTAELLLMDVPDYHELPRRAGHNDVLLVMNAGRIIYRRAGLMAPD
jgi:imidazolonepropionase